MLRQLLVGQSWLLGVERHDSLCFLPGGLVVLRFLAKVGLELFYLYGVVAVCQVLADEPVI